MSLVQPTQPPSVLVAIDIAELRHDVLIEAPGWKNRKRMILPNAAAEFRPFADFLHRLKTQCASSSKLLGTTTGQWRTSCRLRVSIWS